MKEKARVKEHTSMFNEQALSLERLLNELQYPDHIERAVKEKLEKPDIAEIACIAYSGEGFDYPLCKRMPLTRLAVMTWLLQKTYGEYKAIGVADDIIFETFTAFHYKVGQCKEYHQKCDAKVELHLRYRIYCSCRC